MSIRRDRRNKKDRRDLILVGLLFFLAVVGCRKKFEEGIAEVEEALSALITASSGLEVLLDLMGFGTVSKGYTAKPGFTGLEALSTGYVLNLGFTALSAIDRGYTISPGFEVLEAIDRGYIVSPDFTVIETVDRGYTISPGFIAAEAIDRGYTISPGFIPVETVDKGYIVSPSFTAAEAIGEGYMASQLFTALKTIDRGFSISASYTAFSDMIRGLYTCTNAYRPETLECTYRCYVYDSNTNTYIEVDCATLNIALPPCLEACDCCLRNACFKESDRYKSCSQLYDYGTTRVEAICNAKCISGCRLTC
ncbi:MAG: hypothetical protein QXN35_03460 [Ignisphaera sp.]